MNPPVRQLKSREEQERIRLIQQRHEKWKRGKEQNSTPKQFKGCKETPETAQPRNINNVNNNVNNNAQFQQQADLIEQNARGMNLLVTSQLQTHCCPVCFELMKDKERAPMLVIPCGHTFCSACLNIQNEDPSGKTCPYCRSKIASVVLNHSLKQLIESFVQNRQGLVTESGQGQNLHQVSKSLRYNDQLNALNMRIKILENKRKESEVCCQKAIERAVALGKARSALENEQLRIKKKMKDLEDELLLLNRHVKEQEIKHNNACREANKQRQSVQLFDNTIQSLKLQTEKITVLLQSDEI